MSYNLSQSSSSNSWSSTNQNFSSWTREISFILRKQLQHFINQDQVQLLEFSFIWPKCILDQSLQISSFDPAERWQSWDNRFDTWDIIQEIHLWDLIAEVQSCSQTIIDDSVHLLFRLTVYKSIFEDSASFISQRLNKLFRARRFISHLIECPLS